MKKTILLSVLFLFLSTSIIAQKEKKETPKPIPNAQVFESKQNVTIGGQRIDLNAKAGTVMLRDEQNEPIALFGFTSYFKAGAPSSRPIVFAFNGGPGSSSFWLHMGVLGPKRIVVKDPEFTPGAPYQVVNNEYSLLDVADLVMIDPVGTGLSVPVGEAKFEEFWGVDQDIRSIGLFIRQFLIDHGRMNSPKYLLGESYGTFRNAGLMDHLQSRGIAMNGVIMVSAVFDLRSLLFPPNDDLPYLVHFPTYAATSWYHQKIEKSSMELGAFLDEIRSFTQNEYAPALFKGDQLSGKEKNILANKLSSYTGIDADYWFRADLRVKNGEYFQEALRKEGLTVGRLDSRFTGVNQDLLSQFADYDPQSAAISPAYITGFLDYFYNVLGVDKNLTYTTTASQRDNFKWDWKHQGNQFWNADAAINTGIDMARAMTRNPNVKVLILNGIFDIATVFYGVEYSINHLGLPPDLKENIIMEYYEAGHMMYTHQPSIEKFRKDVVGFIKDTSE